MIEMPIMVTDFPHHNDVKHLLLDGIERTRSRSAWGEDGTLISDTDYFYPNEPRYYWDEILDPLILPTLDNIYKKIGLDEWVFDNVWFQKYSHNDTHGWHRHPLTWFSNVYYLDKPNNTPGTELKDPWTGNSLMPEVNEGQILTFPSWVLHRSPPNKDTSIKTVIAFNIK